MYLGFGRGFFVILSTSPLSSDNVSALVTHIWGRDTVVVTFLAFFQLDFF